MTSKLIRLRILVLNETIQLSYSICFQLYLIYLPSNSYYSKSFNNLQIHPQVLQLPVVTFFFRQPYCVIPCDKPIHANIIVGHKQPQTGGTRNSGGGKRGEQEHRRGEQEHRNISSYHAACHIRQKQIQLERYSQRYSYYLAVLCDMFFVDEHYLLLNLSSCMSNDVVSVNIAPPRPVPNRERERGDCSQMDNGANRANDLRNGHNYVCVMPQGSYSISIGPALPCVMFNSPLNRTGNRYSKTRLQQVQGQQQHLEREMRCKSSFWQGKTMLYLHFGSRARSLQHIKHGLARQQVDGGQINQHSLPFYLSENSCMPSPPSLFSLCLTKEFHNRSQIRWHMQVKLVREGKFSAAATC